ncbi:MAG TPA: type II secretion system F family protein, partial [Mycoplana sp.]|nr:type II secretion system F family protein [Mycoplana sp.]
MSELASTLTNPDILLPAFVAIAVLATFFTLAAPYFEGGDLNKRMKTVALERDQIRARERAR